MCNCKKLPSAIADIDYWKTPFDYKGAKEFSAYFQRLDSDDLSPALDYEISNYECRICSQKWYVECAPEQTTWPLFAMKEVAGKLTGKSPGVAAQKALLEVLAHGGFSEEWCLFKNCTGLALNGRFVCYAHLQ
ncbi:hypothetical protein [Janthinobacterium sp. ZB1P44]|uniref:hypothetical protein n=1 Tax=Janthinobacterium sp. ZB1P44 TaxID=3424192 RepID=UPI003F299B70